MKKKGEKIERSRKRKKEMGVGGRQRERPKEENITRNRKEPPPLAGYRLLHYKLPFLSSEASKLGIKYLFFLSAWYNPLFP